MKRDIGCGQGLLASLLQATAGDGRGYALDRWVDRAVTMARGHRLLVADLKRTDR